MESQVLVIAKLSPFKNHAPVAIKTFVSKWQREVGDMIRFENEMWQVQSVFDNHADANYQKKWTVNHYVKMGYWNGSKTIARKF